MNKKTKPMKLTFTSYRDSIGMDGIKVSLDRHAPKLCPYPALNYLIIPTARNLTPANIERICNAILDNNWNLVQGFIDEIYSLGLRHIVLCDWCTREQIVHGKFCPAGIIGRYIQDRADRDKEFEFPIEIDYKDGREVL